MSRHNRSSRTGILGAIILILAGGVLLMERNGFIKYEIVSQWWPLLLVLAGGWLLLARLGRRND